jgi:uncharacterized membrane protein
MQTLEKQIPIWFFIGVVLLIYGVLILASGIYGVFYPPPVEHRVALWELHADIWWSILLIIVGLVYSIKYKPQH